MQCIKSKYSIEDSIKKSRFIGAITPCLNEVETGNYLKQCHLDHPNASHIVFAYRIKTANGFISRYNDAGEPSGTAGKPIFQHLEGNNLINILLVVIRYFGGIKLGAGGLTRAYGNTAKRVIESAELHPFIELVERRLTLDYKQLPTFEYHLKKLDGDIINQNFAEQIHLTIQLPKDNLIALSEQFNGLLLL
ncbi:MAG: YigZ family protein [Methyloglobulus sp.]|nr:YigZ family protein [Methyloglobulus sp.]